VITPQAPKDQPRLDGRCLSETNFLSDLFFILRLNSQEAHKSQRLMSPNEFFFPLHSLIGLSNKSAIRKETTPPAEFIVR
jgi:hypothetical protein